MCLWYFVNRDNVNFMDSESFGKRVHSIDKSFIAVNKCLELLHRLHNEDNGGRENVLQIVYMQRLKKIK